MSDQPEVTLGEIEYFYKQIREIHRALRQRKPKVVLETMYGKTLLDFAIQLRDEDLDIVLIEKTGGKEREEKKLAVRKRIAEWIVEQKKKAMEFLEKKGRSVRKWSPEKLHLLLREMEEGKKDETQKIVEEIQDRISELYDKSQKGLLLNLFYRVSRVGYGALEALLADKLIQAMRTSDDLEKIVLFCEMNVMIGIDKMKKIYPESLAKVVGDICMTAFALRNAVHYRDPATGTEMVSLMLPVHSSTLKDILFFLKGDTESFEYITYSLRNQDNPELQEKLEKELRDDPWRYVKKTLFFGVTKESYNALKTYFIVYGLPIVWESIRKMLDSLSQLKRIIELRLGAVTPFIEITSLKPSSGGREK